MGAAQHLRARSWARQLQASCSSLVRNTRSGSSAGCALASTTPSSRRRICTQQTFSSLCILLH